MCTVVHILQWSSRLYEAIVLFLIVFTRWCALSVDNFSTCIATPRRDIPLVCSPNVRPRTHGFSYLIEFWNRVLPRTGSRKANINYKQGLHIKRLHWSRLFFVKGINHLGIRGKIISGKNNRKRKRLRTRYKWKLIVARSSKFEYNISVVHGKRLIMC